MFIKKKRSNEEVIFDIFHKLFFPRYIIIFAKNFNVFVEISRKCSNTRIESGDIELNDWNKSARVRKENPAQFRHIDIISVLTERFSTTYLSIRNN